MSRVIVRWTVYPVCVYESGQGHVIPNGGGHLTS